MPRFVVSAIGYLACGLAVAPPVLAQGLPVRSVYLTLGGLADAPRGYTAMCEDDAVQCSKEASPGAASSMTGAVMPVADTTSAAVTNAVTDDAPADLTVSAPAPLPQLDMRQLRRVTHFVNVNVRQKSDADIFGADEVWKRSGTGKMASGDCEDLALQKQFELNALGYPPSSTMLAVVYRRSYGLHTVLLVRTQQGDYVLDNMTNSVKPWTKVKYSWLRIQSPEDRNQWLLPA